MMLDLLGSLICPLVLLGATACALLPKRQLRPSQQALQPIYEDEPAIYDHLDDDGSIIYDAVKCGPNSYRVY